MTTAYASPFAQSVSWRQVNQYMYMGDEPEADVRSRLRDYLMRDVVMTPGLRPTVAPEVVER